MLFGEKYSVNCESHIEQTMLKQLVHIVTTVPYRVKGGAIYG